MLRRGAARLLPTAHKQLPASRRYDSLLAVPFEIQRVAYRNNYTPSNIFESRSLNARFVALNRPEALNALDSGMVRELTRIYEEVKEDEMCDAVILYGASDKAFCAGGDVAMLAKQKPVKMGEPCPQLEFFRDEYRLNHLIGTFEPKLHCSLLSGIVMGGGAGLSLHGQYRVCTDDTLFAMPETSIGFFPDVGGSWFLPRMDYNLGFYLGLTGRRLNSLEFYRCGLGTHFVGLGQIPQFLNRLMLTEELNKHWMEEVLDEFCEEPDEEECGVDMISPHLAAIERCFQHDSIKEIREGLKSETGPEHRQWALETLTLLDRASPTSLAVTLEQLKRGAKTASLGECLEMELCIARKFMSGGDFFEGIRAMLVDKDRTPHWDMQPTHDEVLEYFKPLPESQRLNLPKRFATK